MQNRRSSDTSRWTWLDHSTSSWLCQFVDISLDKGYNQHYENSFSSSSLPAVHTVTECVELEKVKQFL